VRRRVAPRQWAARGRQLVRGRELPSLRASRLVVLRDARGTGGHRDCAAPARAVPGGVRDAVRDGAPGFYAALAKRLAVRDLAAPAAVRRAVRARPRAR